MQVQGEMEALVDQVAYYAGHGENLEEQQDEVDVGNENDGMMTYDDLDVKSFECVPS